MKTVFLPDSGGGTPRMEAMEHLPPEAPLAMPERPFASCPQQFGEPATSPPDIEPRRAALIAVTGALALIATVRMAGIAAEGGGISLRELALVVLFGALFAWIAFAFASAFAGFVALLAGGAHESLPLVSGRRPQARTAVLIPIYNEDAVAVAGRVRTMRRSLAAAGCADRFDLFLLSDTRLDAVMRVEEEEVRRLLTEGGPRLYYRRRPENIGRKPGNIAEWIGRFGAAYPQMIVLDADSLMSGDAMATLAATMEANPGVGLIQSLPVVIGARTLFARWQQFAARLYSAAPSAGLLWWSGAEATFWGHNAIIRTRAFADCCGLPALPGKPPFGGPILSHDLVEAAMLRRCGWAVHMVELPDGTFEEYPPTMMDHAIRDRRWCQGNLQHLRLLDAQGFHWASRLQLLMGGSSYLTAPMWLLLLVVGALQPHAPDGSLWFQAPGLSWVFSLTVLLLLGPKLLSVLWVLIDTRRRRAFGGGERILASVAVEMPLAMVVAPVVMMTQVLMLVDLARGRSSGWSVQRRDAETMNPRESLRFYRVHMIAGAAMLALSVLTSHQFMWIMPVGLSLLGAPLIAMLTARRDLGVALLDEELLLTPEEWARLRRRYPPRAAEAQAAAG